MTAHPKGPGLRSTRKKLHFPGPSVVLVEHLAFACTPIFGLDDLDYIQRSPEKA